MKGAPGLNVLSEGAPVDPQVLVDLQGFGYPHVRIDLQRLDLHTTYARAAEVHAMGFQSIPIVNRAEQLPVLFSLGAIPEIGNEPDVDRYLKQNFGTVEQHFRVVDECVAMALDVKQKIYVGAVSNLTKHEKHRGLRFLERYPWGRWSTPEHRQFIGASVHSYPVGLDPMQPHPGFASKREAVEMIQRIVGQRPMAITETGIRDGAHGASESYVAAQLPQLRAFFAEWFEIVCAFGLNDGEDASGDYDPENHYGFRRLDGTWKPVAASFAEAV